MSAKYRVTVYDSNYEPHHFVGEDAKVYGAEHGSIEVRFRLLGMNYVRATFAPLSWTWHEREPLAGTDD